MAAPAPRTGWVPGGGARHWRSAADTSQRERGLVGGWRGWQLGGGAGGGVSQPASSLSFPEITRHRRTSITASGKQCMKRASNKGDEKLLTVQEWKAVGEGRGGVREAEVRGASAACASPKPDD